MKLTVNLEESSSDEELKKLEKEWEDEDGWRPDLRKESQQLMLLLDSEWWKRKMEAPWAVPAAPAASSAEEPQQNPQQHQTTAKVHSISFPSISVAHTNSK